MFTALKVQSLRLEGPGAVEHLSYAGSNRKYERPGWKFYRCKLMFSKYFWMEPACGAVHRIEEHKQPPLMKSRRYFRLLKTLNKTSYYFDFDTPYAC